MKTIKKTIFAITIALTSIFSTSLMAQSTDSSTSKASLSIETDPSTFMFNGYALHVRFKPANSQHFVIGLGAYAMDMPDFFIGKANSEDGWNVRINSAVGVFSEYYLKEANSKWFAGLQASLQNYQNTNDNVPDEVAKYSNLLIMPSIGYNWQPFSKIGLYVKPWLGIGYTTKISGTNELGSYKYNIAPIVPFPTVHIGYRF